MRLGQFVQLALLLTCTMQNIALKAGNLGHLTEVRAIASPAEVSLTTFWEHWQAPPAVGGGRAIGQINTRHMYVALKVG